MTNIDRKQLKLLTESLGRAWGAIKNPTGDTDRNPLALWRMENALCQLKGSIRFHDFDYALQNSALLKYGSLDRIGYGIQGGEVLADNTKTQSEFPIYTSGNWNPGYNGPPTPEGWGVWDYNQWKGYPIDEPLNNYSDGGSYVNRLAQLTPIRYSWTNNNYEQIGFWQNARWISIRNTTGLLSPVKDFKFTLTREDLEGVLFTSALDDMPLDVRFYSHANLHQTGAPDGNGSITSWGSITQPPLGDDTNSALTQLVFTLQRNSSVHTSWDVTITRPAFLTAWADQEWWHIVMYWGSKDTFTNGILLTGAPNPIITVTPEELIKWEKKSYFRNEITDRLTWSSLAINDKVDAVTSNLHLIDRHRAHFTFFDGQFSDPTAPEAYHLLHDWPESTLHGLTNSITGYLLDIEPGDAVPVLYLTKNRGTEYDYPQSDPLVLVGEPVPPEDYPDDWEFFTYWTPAPEDHTIVARVVYRRAPGIIYQTVEGADGGLIGAVKISGFEGGISESNLHQNFSILYIDQPAITFAHSPFDDTILSETLLSSLSDAVQTYRSLHATNPILNTAFNLVVPGSRTPATLANSRLVLANPDGTASKTFRGLLKKPNNLLLKPSIDEIPEAFQFSADTRGMIEELSGLPPSTEVLRFDSDKLYLKNNRFNVPTKFEIFHEPSDSCSVIDTNTAGVRIGLDYKIRLLLEDSDENTFQKDWDIMASKYFLTNQEYDNRVAQGLTTIGYYKKGTDEERSSRAKGTLETIEEWRLYGYAGIVPDLSMGDYRTLYTKVVSPDDETKVTEEQFRKNLENQGYTQEQIDEAVQNYLDAGGEFYTVDLRQYPNDFVALRSAALSAADYSFATIPYWKNNLNPYFGKEQVKGEEAMPSLSSLRADSFTIAPSNLNAGDLENFGTQSQLPADTALNSSTHTGKEKPFVSSTIGFYFTTTDSSGIGEFSFKAKGAFNIDNTTGLFTNSNSEFVSVSLYSNTINDDSQNVPGEMIVHGGTIGFSEFTNVYQEFRCNLYASLSTGTKYWVVIEKSAPTEGGVIVFDSDSATNPTNGGVAYLWDSTMWNTPSANTWRVGSGGAWIKCYDNVSPSSGTLLIDHSAGSYTGIEEPFLAKSQAIYLPSSGLVSQMRSFIVRMKFIPDATNLTNAPYNGADDKITAYIFSDAGGGVPVVVQALDGSFVRINTITDVWQEFTFATDGPTLSSNYWFVLTKNTQTMGGTIVIDKGSSPNNIAKKTNASVWQIDSGTTWFKFYESSRFILGAFNRSSFNILQYLPGPNTAREYRAIYKVDGYWAFTCDKMPTSSPISIYPRAVNDGSWSYVRRSKDIYVCVRYEIGGTTYDSTIKLPAAQGWRNLWWKRNSGSYKFVDINTEPDLDIMTDAINYTGYDFDTTQSTYFNGRFEGTVQALENGAHQIRVIFNDGARVYFNDELLIDSWPTSDPTSQQVLTVMTPVLSTLAGTYYSVVVEYYYGAPYDGSDNQKLNIEWAPPSNLSAYVSLVATEVTPNPIQITPDNVDRIVYLSVGRTSGKFDTSTHGAPPGDVIVLRSI